MSNFSNNESNDNNTIVHLPPPYLPKPEGLRVQTPTIVMAPLKNGGSRRKQIKSRRVTRRSLRSRRSQRRSQRRGQRRGQRRN